MQKKRVHYKIFTCPTGTGIPGFRPIRHWTYIIMYGGVAVTSRIEKKQKTKKFGRLKKKVYICTDTNGDRYIIYN